MKILGRYSFNVLLGQRKLFGKELMFFLDMSECEQRFQLGEDVPSREDYWRYRMGTSAVGSLAAILE